MPDSPTFSRADRSGSDRTAWGDFPEVVTQAGLGGIKDHPDYRAAKSGDAEAAVRVVQDTISDDVLESIRTLIGNRNPKIVAVHAEEASGRNKIPLAYAKVLGQRLRLEVSDDIIQSNKANHTDAGAYHRIAVQPVFDGPVEQGNDYLIVDDTLAMGGTLANLRGHIEANGGNVILASTLTGHRAGLKIGITDQMQAKLINKHGQELNDYINQEFGFGIESLTQGEAGHLRSAPSLDAIRDRLSEARREAGITADRRDPGSSEEVTPHR